MTLHAVGISVVLPIHNGVEHLPAQLDSLANQTLQPAQVIVVDDASTDGSAEVVSAQLGDSVEIVSLDANVGTNAALAVGLSRVTAPVVALCDQDDVWHPSKLAKLAQHFQDPQVVFAFSDAELVDNDGNHLPGTLWKRRRLNDHRRRNLASDPMPTLLRNSLVLGATAMFRSELLKTVLPFPDEILPGHPDGMAHPLFADRWISLIAGGMGSLSPEPAALMQYRVHGSQQTGPGNRFRRGEWPLTSQTEMSSRLSAHRNQIVRLRERLSSPGANPDANVADSVAAYLDELNTRIHLPAQRRRRLKPLVAKAAADQSFGRLPQAVADLTRSA